MPALCSFTIIYRCCKKIAVFHNATKPTELHARERLHARVINTSDRFSAESEVSGPHARQCPHNCTRYDTLVLQRFFANRRISIFSKKAFSAAFRPSSFLHFAILFISFSLVLPFSFSTYLYYLYKKVHDHHCPFVLLRSNKKGLGVSLALRYSVDLSKTHPLYQFIDFPRKNFRLGLLRISSKWNRVAYG